MSPRYIEALSEVSYVINKLEDYDKEKIPEKFRNFIEKNKLKYDKVVDTKNLSEETYAILAIIYRKFLATKEEREELEKEYIRKLKAEKDELTNKKYKKISYDFEVKEVNDKKDLIVECKVEKWYMKLFNKIKQLITLKKDV